jgi:4-amino-4-deoxy-L-arabinose transferase-like glycosyltransferase
VIAPRRQVGALVALGLALRLAFALIYWDGRPLTHDEREYLALGRSLARGDGFRYPADEPDPGTAQRFGRAPGYPAFLAVLGAADPVEHVPRRVQIAQASVGALGIWLIAAIALRAGGPRAAAAAAAIAAVYPPLVWIPAYALSETLFSTLALASALALSRAVVASAHLEARASRPGPRAPLIAAGVLTGAAILTRPALLFFLPLAAVWMARRRRAADAVAFVLLAALCVAPWTVRNYRAHGRWILVASEGGVTFWTGNHPLAIGEGDLAANPAIKRAELAFRAAHPGLTPEQLEPLYYRDALAWIGREPGAWLALVARKAFYTVAPFGPSYTLHSMKYFAASAGAYLLVLPAAAVGAWRSRGTGARAAVPLWLMAAAAVASGLVFLPQERFRIPVIDPALIVTASLLAGYRSDERTGRHANL